MESPGVTLGTIGSEWSEKDCRARISLHLHVTVIWEVRLTICKFVIQIHEEGAYALTALRFKILARLGPITARIVMGLIKGAGFVPDNLKILTTIHGFSRHFTRLGENLAGNWIGLWNPRSFTGPRRVIRRTTHNRTWRK